MLLMALFEQATLKVDNEQQFQELRGAIDRALSADLVARFLKQMESSGVRIRDFDAVLAKGIFEKGDVSLAKKQAGSLYQSLTVSDQSQIREFYLSRIEQVEPALRTKFQKLYRYY
jgi:hypothetical protein